MKEKRETLSIMASSFHDLHLSALLVDALEKLNFTSPTLIQEKAIPLILEGKEVICKANTGSGKTLTFVLPLLSILEHKNKTQALIVTPTRELAYQINEVLSAFKDDLFPSHTVVYGKSDIVSQIKTIKRGVDIIVGTPGRIIDLYEKKVISLETIAYFILDEVDKMVDMGFEEDIHFLLDKVKQAKKAYFSATLSKEVKKIIPKEMIQIEVTQKKLVKEHYFMIGHQERFEALCRLLDAYHISSAIIFCNQISVCNELYEKLNYARYDCEVLHGDLKQEKRIETYTRFKNHAFSYLIASDLACRGLDIEGVSHVINYDFPFDEKTYTHRIGRTGRLDKKGEAFSLVTKKDEKLLGILLKTHEISQETLPSKKELFSSKKEDVLNDVSRIMSSGLHKKYLNDFKGLSRDELVQIASSLLYLELEKNLSFDYQKETIGKKKVYDTILFDLGKNFAVSKKDVYRFLMDEHQFKEEDIESVDISQKGVRIAVTSKRAYDRVLTLNHAILKNKEIRIKKG